MAAAGMNMLVIDLGDAVKYESHPEIAIKNAWTTKRLKTELARLRKLGIEPIPKLNFSASHCAWLGQYRHMISSDRYYAVTAELIAEVCSLFDKPRFLHIGMDEEFAGMQENTWDKGGLDFRYVVVRRGELWWHDCLKLVAEVEKHGVRAWMWSDIYEGHAAEFVKRMPRSVVQSYWYYGSDFSEKKGSSRMYRDIAKAGYDEIPTASNYFSCEESFSRTVDYCSLALPPERLLGFLHSTWKPTQPPWRDRHLQVIAQVKAARESLIAGQAASASKPGK